LKNKDLCLIPARLALALQADGWYVRSDIIWVKPNPMPESVTDRPSKSYDHILMLTKSARYYYDSEAIKEKYTEPLNRWGGPVFRESSHKYIEMGGHDGKQQYGATSMFREGRPVRPNESGRNCRDTWIFPTVGYSGAHFAVFPPELPRRCILAGSSHKACPKCGSPWKRITRPDYRESPRPPTSFIRQQNPQGMGRSPGFAKHGHATKIAETLGWQPTCSCSENDGSGRCLILDPFAGSGTTLAVAAQLGRDYCGIEIAEEYKSLIDKRLKRVRKA
jgi:DNA modification methylase